MVGDGIPSWNASIGFIDVLTFQRSVKRSHLPDYFFIPKMWEFHGSTRLLNIFKFQLCIYKFLQFSSVAQSCSTLCNSLNCSTPGLAVHHQLPEFTQTHVHRVGDAIQPSHPLSSPSPPAPSPSQHQSLFQCVNSSHEVAKVLEFQLSHHSFQRTPRADLL